MQINSNYSNYSPNFGAKFFYSDDLKKVAEYAVNINHFEKLDRARKNIDKAYLKTRLLMKIGENENGMPQVTFTKFIPKKSVLVAKNGDDYREVKSTTYTSAKKINPLQFALNKLYKLGNNAPNNNMYKNVVVL